MEEFKYDLDKIYRVVFRVVGYIISYVVILEWLLSRDIEVPLHVNMTAGLFLLLLFILFMNFYEIAKDFLPREWFLEYLLDKDVDTKLTRVLFVIFSFLLYKLFLVEDDGLFNRTISCVAYVMFLPMLIAISGAINVLVKDTGNFTAYIKDYFKKKK